MVFLQFSLPSVCFAGIEMRQLIACPSFGSVESLFIFPQMVFKSYSTNEYAKDIEPYISIIKPILITQISTRVNGFFRVLTHGNTAVPLRCPECCPAWRVYFSVSSIPPEGIPAYKRYGHEVYLQSSFNIHFFREIWVCGDSFIWGRAAAAKRAEGFFDTEFNVESGDWIRQD